MIRRHDEQEEEKSLGADAAVVAGAGSIAKDAATARHTCEEPSRGSVWRRYPCGKTARFHETKWGKEQWFCGMHAPSEVTRRRDANRKERDRIEAPIIAEQQRVERLRGAAPELLAALKQLVSRVEELAAVKREGVTGAAYDVMTASIGHDITAEFIEAEAAIAKAEGQ